MSMTELAAGARQERQHGVRRSSSRRPLLAGLAVALLCAGLSAWWLVTTPSLEGGGMAGVFSADHEVVAASGLRESVYVVPADEAGESTLAFGIRNEGALAVELVDVWPSLDDPVCIWQPSERRFQDDPRYMGVLDDRARSAVGAVLAPGASATVWITGAHPDPDRCVHDGISLHDDVEVVIRTAGRTTTTRVPLGYTFGYSDDPESLRAAYDYRVLPRQDPASGS